MKCINCGKELKDKAKFCDDCGTKQIPDEVIYETIKEKKSNKGLIITVIILGIVLLASIIIGIWLLLSNNNSNKDNKDNKENKEENTEIVITKDESVYINGYKLTPPEGYTSHVNGSYNYITNNELTIVFVSYPLTYKQIMENKDLLIDTLKQQGYEIESFEDKTFNDKKMITARGKKSSISYGFVFYEIDSETNLFATVTSNYLGKYKEEWIDKTIEFLTTATKEIN